MEWKIDTGEFSSQHHPPLWKRMEPESPCSASSSASSSASKPFTSSHSRSASAPPRSARRRSLRFSLSSTFWLDVVTLQQKYYDVNGLFEIIIISERNVLAVPLRASPPLAVQLVRYLLARGSSRSGPARQVIVHSG